MFVLFGPPKRIHRSDWQRGLGHRTLWLCGSLAVGSRQANRPPESTHSSRKQREGKPSPRYKALPSFIQYLLNTKHPRHSAGTENKRKNNTEPVPSALRFEVKRREHGEPLAAGRCPVLLCSAARISVHFLGLVRRFAGLPFCLAVDSVLFFTLDALVVLRNIHTGK